MNMMNSTYKNFVILPMFLFTIMMTFSTKSIILMWMMMEINTSLFITSNMMMKKNSKEMMNYTLIQILSSMLMLFSMINMNKQYEMIMINMFYFMTFLKLGLSPFHSWFPLIAKTLNWENLFLMMTLLKIIPFMMTIKIKMNYFVYLTLLMSPIMACLLSMKQKNFKSILAYSSMIHSSWMMSINMINHNMMLIYMMMYTLLTLIMYKIMKNINLTNINQMNMKLNYKMKIIIIMMMMSYSGLPPFMGFTFKWMSLLNNISFILIFMNSVYILSSMFMLYFYMKMILMIFFNMKSYMYTPKNKMKINMKIYYILILSIMSTWWFLYL